MSRDQHSIVTSRIVWVWNPLRVDAYAGYLALLSADNSVVAAEDIFSQDNELLLAQGARFSQAIYMHVKDKLLAAPLANLIHIENTIDAQGLLRDLLDIIRSTEYFQSLAERKHPLNSLEPVCGLLSSLPLVRQYLTVMAAQMNDLYQRTLSVSLWALYIAQEMRLPAGDANDIFWAALTHDIGMLHIDPLILNKTEDLTAEDWLHVQSHVSISTAILSGIASVSPATVIAVSEHHERCDGTGYPLAKVESELSIPGQVIAVADAIVGIYFNHFKAQGRRWRDVIPVLEMNRAAYLYRSCDLVTTMILRSELPLPDVVSGGGVPEFAERMLQQNLHLQNWFIQLRDCLTSLGYTHGDRKLHAMQNIVLHIATTFKGSMLFKEDLRASLESMASEDSYSINKVVADASLVQQEMAFHLQRLSRMMQMYIASGESKNPKIARRLQEGFSNISGFIN
ncbi:MAG TPA: HD domain-containing phosphohydrolase [Cellvibrio sp.]|nr:HD domain-containing phosphohydrolase [Cellvibrio sp.]